MTPAATGTDDTGARALRTTLALLCPRRGRIYATGGNFTGNEQYSWSVTRRVRESS